MLDEVHFVQCHLLLGMGGGITDALCLMAWLWQWHVWGSVVLRLCMMNTLPANPPVGGHMPVNYCTFGEEGGKRKNRDEEHMKKKWKKERKKRRERQGVR